MVELADDPFLFVDKYFTNRDCFVRALEILSQKDDGLCPEEDGLCPEEDRIWFNLAHTIPLGSEVPILGGSFSRQECTVRALEINPSECLYWTLLGSTIPSGGSVYVSGKPYTQTGCFNKPLEAEPEWDQLGKIDDAAECAIRALEQDPRSVDKWVGRTWE